MAETIRVLWFIALLLGFQWMAAGISGTLTGVLLGAGG